MTGCPALGLLACLVPWAAFAALAFWLAPIIY